VPNILQAGLIRSLGAASSAARTSPSRDARPSGDFLSYLDVARNADRRDDRRADAADDARDDDAGAPKAEKPRDSSRGSDAGKTRDGNTDAAAQAQAATVAAATTAPIVVVVESPKQAGDGQSQATNAEPQSDTAALSSIGSTGDGNEGAAKTAPTGEHGDAAAARTTNGGAQDAATQPATGEQALDQPAQVTTQSAGTEQPASSDESTVQTQVNDDGSTAVNDKDVVVDRDGSPIQRRSDSTDNTRRDVRLVETTSTAEAAQDKTAREPVHRSQSDECGESVRDVRMRDALDRALAGGKHDSQTNDSNDPQNGGRPESGNRSISKVHDQVSLKTKTDATNAVGATELPQTASIRTAEGDGVAAAIGRFLVTASGDAGGRRATPRTADSGDEPTVKLMDAPATKTTASPLSGLLDGTAKPVAAGGGNGTGGATAARATGTSTFSQILNSRLDPAQSLDATARVLSASNASNSPNKWDVTLRLDPPELGGLKVAVRMEDGAMNLRVDADSRSAGKLIESRLGDLRDALAAHGIAVDRMQVVVKSDAGGQADTQQRHASHDDQPPSRSSHHDASGGFAGQSDGGRSWDGNGRSNGDGAWWDGNAWSGWNGAADTVAAEPIRADVTPTSETSVNLVA